VTETSYIVLGLLERAGSATPYDLERFAQISVFNFWPVPTRSSTRNARAWPKQEFCVNAARRTGDGGASTNWRHEVATS
jgi:hypothetical protein